MTKMSTGRVENCQPLSASCCHLPPRSHHRAQDALLALRESVVRAFDVREDGDNLVLLSPSGAQVSFPKTTKTAFKKGTTVGHYTLFALWLQWVYKDKSIMDLWAECEKKGLTRVNVVLVPDKRPLLAYLSGADDGAAHIDRDVVGEAGVALAPARASSAPEVGPSAAVGPVGGSSLVGATLDSVVADSLRAAGVAEVLRLERSLRCRTSILDAPGLADLRDLVFKCFGGKEDAAAAGAGGAAAAGAGVGPAGAGAGASSGVKKRGRDSVGGGGAAPAAPQKPCTCGSVWVHVGPCSGVRGFECVWCQSACVGCGVGGGGRGGVCLCCALGWGGERELAVWR